MKNKTEKNTRGIDCTIESYYPSGQLQYRSEWNADRTATNVVDSYYQNGQLECRSEWNADRTATDIVESYYQNGQLGCRCEWDVARMKTCVVERYSTDGKLIKTRVWNFGRTDTCVVEQGIHNTAQAPVEVKESNKLLEAIATLYARKLISAPETIELLRNL
jgi:antitoxin component YwqK of YwqJK toxin-antitoxin module